ncbi:beta-ketoacyl-[acyl-carrier-protein] synthase family protein [Glutamicibacter endophyticus]|uniref:beta-ketoacyl-[acyl-carrier-protein] synthase family protein n=1 Tax=Glutamicibacter endophyticus TaxID=1522174 RepID=UPI003AF0D56B
MTDIVVTGYGAITPLGLGTEALFSGLAASSSGIAALTDPRFAEAGVPDAIAGAVTVDMAELLGKPATRRLDRSQQFALVAAEQAWADAGFDAETELDPERLAAVIGTGIGGLNTLLDQEHVLLERGARRVSPRTVPMLMANAASAQVAMTYGAKAGTYTPVSACAAGAEALATAARLIATGEADVVIAGGAEAAIAPLTVAAFSQAQALAKPDERPAEELSRPFSADRAGFVLGEGAGVVILESAEHAARRGARAHARLSGWAITSDAYHITASDPSGAGQIRAMRQAIKLAGLTPSAVGHLNAHATGTTVGDLSESKAVNEVFEHSPAVTAPKGALGHLVGAAGAVEAIVTIMSLEQQIIPPTRNLSELDEEITLDVVHTQARETTFDHALSNSFGFGGQNVSLLFSKA